MSLALAGVAGADTLLYRHDGARPASQSGACVELLPDLDGDGVEDYAVGAPFEDYYANGTRRGVVRVYSGKTGLVMRTLVGSGSQSEFGASIAAIPDISGDGRRDLLIGAPSHTSSLSRQGAAFLINSATGSQLGAYYGSSVNEYLGTDVANFGDVDGDGEDDWAISAPFADVNGVTDCGRVRVYNGNHGGLIQQWSSGASGVLSGWRIAGLGDISGDGRADFVVTAPGYTDTIWNRAFVGGAYVILGGGNNYTGAIGVEPFEQLGQSLAVIGDITGDGKSEYALGAPNWDGAGASRGRVRVINPVNGAEVFNVVSGIDGSKLGTALAPVGDYDGDGVRDFAVGVPGANLVTVGKRGLVYVYSGASSALLATYWGYENDSDFGRALSGGVDLNDDGVCEILIGAPAEDSNGSNAGTARLLLGGVANPTRYGAAKVNSWGCTPRIDFSGAASRTLGNDFHITASNIVPQKTGMLFWGFTSANTPFKGGTMLVGQPLVRTAAQNSGGIGFLGQCDGAFDFHFSQQMMQSYNLPSGMRLYAQYWHRDPGFAFPNNIGLTNALRFDISN